MPSGSILNHYRNMLQGKRGSALESTNKGVSLSNNDIREREGRARDSLYRIVDKYMKDDPHSKQLVNRIIADGGEGLRMVAANDEARLQESPETLEGLEAIVRTDGSRPSFLVVNDMFDLESSPAGDWEEQLAVNRDDLQGIVKRVGRIDVPGMAGGYTGTGFLIHDNFIVTNRHVLQISGTQNTDGEWRFHDGAAIDFGHELDGIKSFNRRTLQRVVFAGDQEISFNRPIDHSKLDLAIIELEPSEQFISPTFQLTIDFALDNGEARDRIYTIGYPGNPTWSTYSPSLLDQLFQSQFGFKRLAPGLVINTEMSSETWTIGHDATTLGGNSGSVVVEAGQEGLAVGLHYGGRSAAPAENWGHRLSMTMEQLDGQTGRPLREVLEEIGIPTQGQDSGPARPTPPPSAEGELPPHNAPASSSVLRPLPDWRHGVTLEMMKRLSPSGGLEAPGDGHTRASEFEGRGGYDPDFIDGMHVRLPMPSGDIRRLRRGGNGAELKYEHFSIIMSDSRRLPMVTACNIDGARSRRLPRIRQWSYDGRLNHDDQIGNELYRHNDADRGHMVRREDPVWGARRVAQRANVDTFHYTNACPQMAGVNQRVWLGLENYILLNAREDDMRVSVFTGPYLSGSDIPYRNAHIPKAFWKVVAFVTDRGRFSATAYRVSQERALADLEFTFAGFKTFQISIQQVMDATGIDFSHLLPFDGFSQHERVHGVPVVEQLERFEQIRV